MSPSRCHVSRHNALRRITSCFSFRYNKQLIDQVSWEICNEDLFNPENLCHPRATGIFWFEQIFMSPSKLGNKCLMSSDMDNMLEVEMKGTHCCLYKCFIYLIHIQ